MRPKSIGGLETSDMVLLFEIPYTHLGSYTIKLLYYNIFAEMFFEAFFDAAWMAPKMIT